MSATVKRPYIDALAIATELEQQLGPACDRLLVAGSLRRKKAVIGDIELVVIPTVKPDIDLFGEPVAGQGHSLLDDVLATLPIWYYKNGPKYKQFLLGTNADAITVDLFIVTPATWGVNATIRTGCAEFSRWLVTDKRHGGAMPGGMRPVDGRLHFAGQILDTPTEESVFAALGIDWILPEERTEETVKTLWRR
jgi:DNA polymerase/3'-5' exonuclease PolX